MGRRSGGIIRVHGGRVGRDSLYDLNVEGNSAEGEGGDKKSRTLW